MATTNMSETTDQDNFQGHANLMSLPAELRIVIYHHVFNASLDNTSQPDPLDHTLMHKGILSLLHINQTTRKETHTICIDLANRHIKALEASIRIDHSALRNTPELDIFAPRVKSQYEDFLKHMARDADKLSRDANRADALYDFLEAMGVPCRGRAYVQTLTHIHLKYQVSWEKKGLGSAFRKARKGGGGNL